MTNSAGLCKMCKKPFSPTHNHRAPGPTVRHPFFPEPLADVIEEAKQDGSIVDAAVTEFDVVQNAGTFEDPDVTKVGITVVLPPKISGDIEFTIFMKPRRK